MYPPLCEPGEMKVLVKYGLDASSPIELLADSSIIFGNRPLFVPDWASQFEARVAVAFRVGRLGKCVARRFASRYWDAFTGCLVTRGLDEGGTVVLHDALTRSHDGALLLGQMIERADGSSFPTTLTWLVGHQVSQHSLGTIDSVAEDTLSQVSQYMTLKMGDLLCLCLEATHPLAIDTVTELLLDERSVLKTKIK